MGNCEPVLLESFVVKGVKSLDLRRSTPSNANLMCENRSIKTSPQYYRNCGVVCEQVPD